VDVLQVSAEKQGTDALAFLKPFTWQLWLAIVASMLGVAFIGWLLARLSPLGRYEVDIRGSQLTYLPFEPF
jgi:hypothetical protein